MCGGLSPNSLFHRTLQKKVIQRAEVQPENDVLANLTHLPLWKCSIIFFFKMAKDILSQPTGSWMSGLQIWQYEIPPWYLCVCSADEATTESYMEASLVHQLGTPSLQKPLPVWFSCVPRCPCHGGMPRAARVSGYFSGSGGGGWCWLIHTLFSGFRVIGLSSLVSGLWPHGKEAKRCPRNQIYRFRAFQATGLGTAHPVFKGRTEDLEGTEE